MVRTGNCRTGLFPHNYLALQHINRACPKDRTGQAQITVSCKRNWGFYVWLWEKSVLAAKLLSRHELVCVCWAVLNLFSTASPLCYRTDSVDTETRLPWQWWIHLWILMCCIWVQLAKANMGKTGCCDDTTVCILLLIHRLKFQMDL